MSEGVSVVMPVYEDGERASVAIRALLDLAPPPEVSLEIMVVDDGSRDNTADLIAGMSDRRVNLRETDREPGTRRRLQ